ncbi:MAG: phosphate-binding protein, partial [Psychrobium sp.]
MKLLKLARNIGFTLLTTGVAVSASASTIDKKLPEYVKTQGVSGNMSSVGSDTLANMMTFWAEEFKRNYPNVNIQIQAAG